MIVLLAALLAAGPAAAQTQARYASIVVDAATGRVVHERHADELRFPASLTKMMTLYMLFEAVREGRITHDTAMPVSQRAASMVPSKLGLRPGQSIRVDHAIRALITRSANDVAVVVAEALAGSEQRFGERMTQRARRLGMARTTFRNASGLPDPAQRSTARDMVTLSRALLRDFPVEYALFSTRQFRYAGQTYRNHNGLLGSYDGMDGIKTGYIRASGFNIAASAVRGGRRLVAVVFGGRTAASRNAHVVALLDQGFRALPALPAPRLFGPPVLKPGRALIASAPAPAAPPPVAVTPAAAPPAAPVVVAAAPTPLGPPALRPAEREEIDLALLPGSAELRPEIDEGSREIGPFELGRDYGIQLGAFQEVHTARGFAQTTARALGPKLGGGRIEVQPVDSVQGRLFRSLILGLSAMDAEAACEMLRQQRRDCMMVRAPSSQQPSEALPARRAAGTSLGSVY